MSEDPPTVSAEDSEERDFRLAALLVDPKRREFLATLDPMTVNSYAVLYGRALKWIAYAKRGIDKAQTKNDEVSKMRWSLLKERWELSLVWLDKNLMMSGSIRGRRAEQLVDVLAGAREQPSMGGTAVVYPALPNAPPPSQPKSILRR